MTIIAQAVAPQHQLLDENTIRETLERGLGGKFTGAKVLVLIPDHTRTIPLPLLFRHAAQIRRRPEIRSDRDRSSHRGLLATTGNHHSRVNGIPRESHQPRASIRCNSRT